MKSTLFLRSLYVNSKLIYNEYEKLDWRKDPNDPAEAKSIA